MFSFGLDLKGDWDVGSKGRDLWGKIKLVLNIAPLICDNDVCVCAVSDPEASLLKKDVDCAPEMRLPIDSLSGSTEKF